jgi:hypothetical protein
LLASSTQSGDMWLNETPAHTTGADRAGSPARLWNMGISGVFARDFQVFRSDCVMWSTETEVKSARDRHLAGFLKFSATLSWIEGWKIRA